MVAVKKRQFEAVEALVQAGADLSMEDRVCRCFVLKLV
jgi:hypothetical protein